MKRTIATLFALLLAVAGVAAAQEGIYEYPEYDAYDYGLYGGELGEVSEIEGYDEESVGYPYGNLTIVTEGTQGQAIDVVITGPDGYTETFESEAGVEAERVELPVGVYSISATDDGLEMGHALVNVRLGQLQTLRFTLPPYVEADLGVGEGYGLEAGYYGAEEEFGEGYEPYGFNEVEGYEAYENEDSGAIAIAVEGYQNGEVIGYDELGGAVVGHIVGPDDERDEFGDEQLTTFEDLPAGLYSISATAPGSQVSQTYVQVQQGQTALLRVRLTGMEAGAMGGVGAAGIYSAWDADASGDITIAEFETGLYNTFAGADAELSEAEFNEGFTRFGMENQYAFADFDADTDAVVTEAEFTTTYEPTLFGEWDRDTDQVLTEEEFRGGWFDVIDANDDAMIDETEYAGYEGMFGTEFGEFAGDDAAIDENEWMGL